MDMYSVSAFSSDSFLAINSSVVRSSMNRILRLTLVLSFFAAAASAQTGDAVLLFADNRASSEWGVRALGRGLPVMVEKPMAADLGGADALLGAARLDPSGRRGE